jgi:hypothetical protein
MNEEFAIDPEACQTGYEFKSLLAQFGPFAGRYSVRFPKDWIARTFDQVEGWPDGLSKVAGKRALQQAQASGAFVRSQGRVWSPALDWPANVRKTQASARPFHGVVARRELADEFPVLETFDPPPSTEIHVLPTASALASPARYLLETGPEVALVDPYFNPCRENNAAVLIALLKIAASTSTCVAFSVWSFADAILAANSEQELRCALRDVSMEAGFAPQSLSLKLVGDAKITTATDSFKFHPRYLLTAKGGLRYDAGFKKESGKAKVEISVVGRGTHSGLVSIYLEGAALESIRCAIGTT